MQSRKLILSGKVIFSLIGIFIIPGGTVFAGPEDLTGYWRPLIMEDFQMRMRGVKKGDYGGFELTEAARAVADKFKPGAGEDELLFDKCGPHGPPRIMFTDTRLRITQDDNEISMELEAEGQLRRFYLEGRKWRGGEPQLQGHSVAHEDGKSMLTVVTRYMRPGLLRGNGIPYSDEAVLTEHYTRHGDYFTVIQALEDPKYLKEPFITSTSFRRIPEPTDWRPGYCRP